MGGRTDFCPPPKDKSGFGVWLKWNEGAGDCKPSGLLMKPLSRLNLSESRFLA